MKNITRIISNPKIFVFTIIWLMILVFIGTIAQKDIGLFAAQNKYFSSAFIWVYIFGFGIPLPGGLLTMTFLAMNLFSFILKPNIWNKNKIGVIGKNILPVSLFNSIAKTLPKSTFVFCDDLIIDERKIKSPAEINLMGKAAAINDKVLKQVLNKVEIGMTEIQIAGLAEAIARHMGADIASATVVMSGPNTNYPAWRPSERKVEAGENRDRCNKKKNIKERNKMTTPWNSCCCLNKRRKPKLVQMPKASQKLKES